MIPTEDAVRAGNEKDECNKASYNREPCLYDYQPVNGYINTPELPGIDNELSEYALKTANMVAILTSKLFKMEKFG
jgi:hypothetical protein